MQPFFLTSIPNVFFKNYLLLSAISRKILFLKQVYIDDPPTRKQINIRRKMSTVQTDRRDHQLIGILYIKPLLSCQTITNISRSIQSLYIYSFTGLVLLRHCTEAQPCTSFPSLFSFLFLPCSSQRCHKKASAAPQKRTCDLHVLNSDRTLYQTVPALVFYAIYSVDDSVHDTLK